MKLFALLAFALPIWGQTGIDVGAQAKSSGQSVTLVLFFSGPGAPAAATCPTTPTARLYLDSAASRLYYCTPTGWQQVPLAVTPALVSHTDTFTVPAVLSAQTYTTKIAPASPDVQIYVNGLLMDTPGDYTLSGSIVTFVGPTGSIVGATVKVHYQALQ